MTDDRPGTEVVPEEIELLLPWYQSGTLTESERRLVEEFLSANPAMKNQLRLIDEEMDLVRADNESLPVPNREGLSRLIDTIENEPAQDRFGQGDGGALANWLGRLFPSPAMAIRAGFAACLLIIAVQFGILVYGDRQADVGFQTAAGPTSIETSGVNLLVSFNEAATLADIAKLLESFDAAIVDGPRAGGLFVVSFPEGSDQTGLVDELLKSSDLVSFAAPEGS